MSEGSVSVIVAVIHSTLLCGSLSLLQNSRSQISQKCLFLKPPNLSFYWERGLGDTIMSGIF